MSKELTNKKVIKDRLEELKESFACLAIENINISQDDKTFMKKMIEQGKTPDEMSTEIRKRMNLSIN